MDYNTPELIEVISKTTPINKFFTTFFPTRRTHLKEDLEVQVKKGKKKMAPFVAPKVGGKVIKRDGFTSFQVKAPKIAPIRVLTVDDLSKRMLGEDVFTKKTPEDRADELLAQDMTDLEDLIANRVEWMARQIILNGAIDVSDAESGVEINVDYNFTNREALTGVFKWSESTSDPIEDLKKWRVNVIQKSGVSPSLCIMGQESFKAFRGHNKVKEYLNIRNMNIGELKPTIIDKALTFQGKIEGIEIYTYDEWFLDDNDESVAMMPVNEVLLLPLEIGSIEYGSYTQLEDGEYKTYENEIIPRIDVDQKNDTKTLRLVSRPIVVPFDVDGWYVAEVVAKEA